MDHDDDGETSYNTIVDDVAFEPTYSQALLTAAGRNVATVYAVLCNGGYSILSVPGRARPPNLPNAFLVDFKAKITLSGYKSYINLYSPKPATSETNNFYIL